MPEALVFGAVSDKEDVARGEQRLEGISHGLEAAEELPEVVLGDDHGLLVLEVTEQVDEQTAAHIIRNGPGLAYPAHAPAGTLQLRLQTRVVRGCDDHAERQSHDLPDDRLGGSTPLLNRRSQTTQQLDAPASQLEVLSDASQALAGVFAFQPIG